MSMRGGAGVGRSRLLCGRKDVLERPEERVDRERLLKPRRGLKLLSDLPRGVATRHDDDRHSGPSSILELRGAKCAGIQMRKSVLEQNQEPWPASRSPSRVPSND